MLNSYRCRPHINFRTLDLNLLRLFDRVIAEGSLTRAAAELAMTQPAASHALKRLHAAVGEPLFVRSAFGMKPTARAEALWPRVREALDALASSRSRRLKQSVGTVFALGPTADHLRDQPT